MSVIDSILEKLREDIDARDDEITRLRARIEQLETLLDEKTSDKIAAIKARNQEGDGDENARLRAENERLRAEIERRDANERRNCINWGPCSQHDGSMPQALQETGDERD